MKAFAPFLLSLCIANTLISTRISAQTPIEIGNAYSIYSGEMRADYQYWVSLPKGYSDTTYLEQSYPVCYFFDGDSHFETLVSQRNRLASGFYASMPNVIMVGIVQIDRTNELTPSHMETPENWKRANFSTSGGNTAFMQFIEDELKPHINGTYRTNGYEILVGHSFGGLATVHALLHRPSTFDAYVALDPSIWWNNEEMLEELDSVWNPKAYEHVSFFLAKANDPGSGRDHQDAISTLAKRLDSLQSESGLRMKFVEYPTENHGSVVVPAEYDALRFIFEGYALNVKSVMRNPSEIENHYNGVSSQLGYKVLPPEWLLDQLADICVRQDLNHQALELLTLAAHHYPESTHAQNRLIQFKGAEE